MQGRAEGFDIELSTLRAVRLFPVEFTASFSAFRLKGAPSAVSMSVDTRQRKKSPASEATTPEPVRD
jgi:hypothetical protein